MGTEAAHDGLLGLADSTIRGTALASYSRACRIHGGCFRAASGLHQSVPDTVANRDTEGNAIADHSPVSDRDRQFFADCNAVLAAIDSGSDSLVYADDRTDFDAESISDAIARSYGYAVSDAEPGAYGLTITSPDRLTLADTYAIAFAEPGADGNSVTRTNGDAVSGPNFIPNLAHVYPGFHFIPDTDADKCPDCYSDAPSDCFTNPLGRAEPCANPE